MLTEWDFGARGSEAKFEYRPEGYAVREGVC